MLTRGIVWMTFEAEFMLCCNLGFGQNTLNELG
jgi:hypothetical protein